jgi:hypothetical protein
MAGEYLSSIKIKTHHDNSTSEEEGMQKRFVVAAVALTEWAL